MNIIDRLRTRVRRKYSSEDSFLVDLLILFILVYTPIVIPQAWLMWLAAMGQSLLIGRRLR